MGKIYQVKVFGIDRELKVIDLCDSEEMMKKMTVLDLKKKVVERFPGTAGRLKKNNETNDLQMIFANQRLDDENELLYKYGIQHLSVIQLVVRLNGGLPA
uniref:Ubiquitin-like domain-containing protein n=1 Tax=Pundamilia nyererei TaxID=303518 RepID=A0A3B4FWW0_9CICH